MLKGEPRRPWIDIESEKLIHRHLSMILIQEFLKTISKSLDTCPTKEFVESELENFNRFCNSIDRAKLNCNVPSNINLNFDSFIESLNKQFVDLNEKVEKHPELYEDSQNAGYSTEKNLLDALYEEGIIPTYSFPKDVVSTYITDHNGKLRYQVERGLDIAISEFAPGRSIVVDKQTYQIVLR